MSDDPYRRDRRLGRWMISGKRYMYQVGLQMAIQRDTEIIRMAPHIFADVVECIGRGPQFDITEEGAEIPLYEVGFNGHAISWRRA